ncbi:MAG: DUF1552 domain-containing protein [Limisphaerales bacterium]
MNIDRRNFLRATGVTLALPWLETFVGAKSGVPPKRAVFIGTALGLHAPHLYPRTSGANYETTEYLSLLKRHRADYTLFSGLSHPDQGGEHETEKTFLTAARNPQHDGFRNSLSIDQLAAERLGYVTRFPSISLSSNGPKSQSFTVGGVMLPAESSPSRMFAKLFLQGKPAEIAQQKQKLADGRSVLDELMAQSKLLIKSVTASDREKLDEYFESVRKTERDLKEAQAWMDRPKPKVVAKQPQDIFDKTDLIGRIRLLMNLVPLIIQSDSTRVVSVVIQDHLSIPQINGVESEHHNLSHHGRDPNKIAQLKRIEMEIIKQYGELLGRLKTKKEVGGSLLDNTMTLFGSNLGNANAHDPRNLPIFLAGGGFKHGKYIAHDRQANTPLSNLFVTMLQRLGLESDSFGDSNGTISEV